MKKQDKEVNNERWKHLRFMVFDAPLVPGDFQTRLDVCKAEIKKVPGAVCEMVKQTVCTSKENLATLMDDILSGKGEGVMLKDPSSLYEGKRTKNLLKVKKFDDAEATVIGHLRGEGRCDTMTGAIQVREKDGTEFKIGSGFSDKQRKSPPKKGSVVTFKYQGRSKNGIPRFPIFMRMHAGV